MSGEPSALQALAARCGIQPSFRDARGETKVAGQETQRALLAAMGFDAADDAAARTVMGNLDRAEWERVVAPVSVVYRGDTPLDIAVTLPAGTTTVAWRIELEDGGERRGEAPFGSLILRERRTLQGVLRERRELVIGDLPLGYHQLHVLPGDAAARLIVSPGACWLPTDFAGKRRLWGVTAQLYLLRSAQNWGIGDYGDLARLVKLLVAGGADAVGLNPLHALFLDAPEQASPYSPASRLQLNVLNIDVARLVNQEHCREALALIEADSFQRDLRRCREARQVDYSGVLALKLPMLRLAFACARAQRESPRWRAFEAFRREGGALFERGCIFQALREHFSAMLPAQADWHAWPHDYRDPDSPTVARFAAAHAEAVGFHAWLQFVADTQLAAAAAAAAPMAVGLYRDLAVGADPSGAETWAGQKAVVADAQVGAPPDIYNPPGQDWGLPPFNPHVLREEGYQSFIDLVRANMRYAGGLRIDHVMGLHQLYWVPKGRSPADGAYVRYPLEDLIGILALESQRNRCLVVGEDLGTVPEGFRERLAKAGIISYRVLLFEKDDDGFIAPERYPALALAVASSHDLPTLRAWWEASDLELKDKLHLYPTPDAARKMREERRRDRAMLAAAFGRAGLLETASSAEVGDPPAGETALHHAAQGQAALGVEEFSRAAHAFLARGRAALAMVQMDELCDEATPVNVPTTSDEHPNWRRRQSLTLEELAVHPRLAELAAIFRRERAAAIPAERRTRPAEPPPLVTKTWR